MESARSLWRTICVPVIVDVGENLITVGAWAELWDRESGKRRMVFFIREDRYTAELLTGVDEFSVIVPESVEALKTCGRVSGRTKDKKELCAELLTETNSMRVTLTEVEVGKMWDHYFIAGVFQPRETEGRVECIWVHRMPEYHKVTLES